MSLKSTYLAVLILFIGINHNLNAQSTNDVAEKGIIRIKLSAQTVSQATKKSAGFDKKNVFVAGPEGYVKTNIVAIDRLNKTFDVSKMKRVYRYAGKHEAKHRAWGLHLWYEVKYESQAELQQIRAAYQNLPQVQIAELSHKVQRVGKKAKLSSPGEGQGQGSLDGVDDPQFGDQWHYENTGQFGGTPDADISLLDAWKIETGNKNVIVAIEDGGVDVDHIDLKGNMWVNPGEIKGNGIDDDNNGFIDDVNGWNFVSNSGKVTGDGHGTHVAGTVAAESNNGIGVAGVAGGTGNDDGVRLMSCQVFSGNSTGGFAEAYTYAADNGAVISQNSWGYRQADIIDQAILDGIDYFIANAGGKDAPMQGGLVIFAAGNSNSDGKWWPGYYDKVLSVAATNNKDIRADYSNYGTWVDISAPGGDSKKNVVSTLPNNKYGSSPYYGTSMACPHVSGVAALIISQNLGKITPKEVWDILVNNTDDIYTKNKSYEGKLGSGRLNAYKALTASPATVPTTPTGIQTSQVGATSFTAQWNNVAGATSYDIQYRKEGNSSWTKENTSESSIVIKGLSSTSTYEYRVSAKNSAGTSPYSSIKTVTTKAQVCDVPSSVSVSNVTATSASVSWSAVNDADSYELQYRATGGSWTTEGASTTSYTLSGLSEKTTYEVRVRTSCSFGSSDFSSIETFTTTDTAPVDYCATGGESTRYEWIDLVEIGSINRSSRSDGGYVDMTEKSTTIQRGAITEMFVSAGFSGSQYRENWKIWIDLNQDGDFKDSGELLKSGSTSNGNRTRTELDIPASASLGATRLRVTMSYNQISSSCGSYEYGETEDYTVIISDSAPAIVQMANALSSEKLSDQTINNSIKLFPNPVIDYLRIDTRLDGAQQVKIYTLKGELQKITTLGSNKTISVNELQAGTYILSITDGQKTEKLSFIKK